MTNAQHSNQTHEWYTPQWVIDKSLRVLGGSIDLDPCSSEKANETVGASRIFTAAGDGLDQSWEPARTIFLNPPSGGRGQYNKPRQFWNKLMSHRMDSPYFTGAIYVAFSMEQLQTTQSDHCVEALTDFTLCIPSKRIRFVSPEGEKNSPTHGNAIVMVPGYCNWREMQLKFYEEFSTVGSILTPLLTP